MTTVGTVDIAALTAKESLNPVQQEGVRKIVNYVTQLKARKEENSSPEPTTMNSLVHDGPGTGKTH